MGHLLSLPKLPLQTSCPCGVKGLVQLRMDQDHPSYLRLVPSYAPSTCLLVAAARCGLAGTLVGTAGIRATQCASSVAVGGKDKGLLPLFPMNLPCYRMSSAGFNPAATLGCSQSKVLVAEELLRTFAPCFVLSVNHQQQEEVLLSRWKR